MKNAHLCIPTIRSIILKAFADASKPRRPSRMFQGSWGIQLPCQFYWKTSPVPCTCSSGPVWSGPCRVAKWASRLDGIQDCARASPRYRSQLGTASATRRPLGCGVEKVDGPRPAPGPWHWHLGLRRPLGRARCFLHHLPPSAPLNKPNGMLSPCCFLL